jgi:asparagine synthase (glutamine-hydrolysing)
MIRGSEEFPFQLQMMLRDTTTFLPNDVLTKVDRASMACSLEVRTPFLGQKIVEFAWRLPLEMKIKGKQGKWILRHLLSRYVPRNLWQRPKNGFGIPLGEWLRGPMRDWAEDLLAESRLRNESFLNPVIVREKWVEHLSRRQDWQYHLWDVLMFQSWLEEFKTKARSSALEAEVHA